MPDGDYQGDFYRYAVEAVRGHFRPRPEVYVTGDLFIYLEEGNPNNRIAPDLYVVMNGGHRMRDTYKLWEEPGGMPDFILEIVSPSTWRTDLGAKFDQYMALGVGEYWLYDPHANYMNPALAGHRLVGREYEPIPGIELSDGTLTVHSPTLGLDLRLKGKDMRFFDPVCGQYMLATAEIAVQVRAAKAELHAAETEARAAKAELRAAEAEARAAKAELRAVKAKARAAQAESRAVKAKARAAQAESRAVETEARAAETRIAELELDLADNGRG